MTLAGQDAAARDAEPYSEPLDLTVARFMHVYGAATFLGPWPQTGGLIPWRLFWTLAARIPAVAAFDRVNTLRAVGAGTGLAMTGNDASKSASQRDIAEAFPKE